MCMLGIWQRGTTLWAESTEHSNTMEGNPSCSLLVSTQIETSLDLDLSGCMRMGLGNNLAWTYLAGMPQFLKWANFLLRFSTRLARYYSNVQCSTIYSLPVISRTQTLVGWSGGLPLVNTDGKHSSAQDASGQDSPQTLVHVATRVWGPD